MRPRLTLIAGPNGSGKTTLTQKLAETTDLGPVINPDAFILQHADCPPAEAIRAGTRDVVAKRKEYLEAGCSFALETVFSSRDKTDFLLSILCDHRRSPEQLLPRGRAGASRRASGPYRKDY